MPVDANTDTLNHACVGNTDKNSLTAETHAKTVEVQSSTAAMFLLGADVCSNPKQKSGCGIGGDRGIRNTQKRQN